MLSATTVQKMIEAADFDTIAHGYTFDRNTLDIYFEDGNLIRRETNGEKVEISKSSEFNEDFFFNNVKRWYAGTKTKGLNPKLKELFETFGKPLPVTSGGRYESP